MRSIRAVSIPLRRLVLPPLAALCLAMIGALQAHAAPIQPWVPPHADTLLAWAAQTRVQFQANTGDSVGGRNYAAYERVGTMGRTMLESMGRAGMVQAPLMEGILDSVGLDVDVVVDQDLPFFTLMMVRNPHRTSASSVAFLYWWRQQKLMTQGLLFQGGRDPKSRVWWTGRSDAPYAWGIIDRNQDPPRVGLTLMRLNRDGFYWNLLQYPSDSTALGTEGSAEFADINRDGSPEVVAWVRTEPDPMFAECRACPALITERTFVERRLGFQLEESRVVPTTFANFAMFLRMLREGRLDDAERLVARPSLIQRALEYGWNRKGDGIWRFEYAEEGEQWPRWMVFALEAADGKKTAYMVRFGPAESRWIVEDFGPAAVAGSTPGNAGRN